MLEIESKRKVICPYITEKWFMDSREYKKPRYEVSFIYNEIKHLVGSFKDLKEAKIELDKKRVQLGLEPVYLKRATNNLSNMKVETKVFKSGKELKDFLNGVELMPAMFNRKVKDSHVKNMIKSIETIGIQRSINIISTKAFNGKTTLYTADGQHLAKGIISIPDEQLKGHFVVFINNIDSINKIIPFISLMNSTAKNWTLEDYLNAWVTHGLKDYEYIRNIRLSTGYGISGLIEAFSNKASTGNIDFKNGTFKANKANGIKMIELYKKAVAMGLRDSNSAFLGLVRFFISNPSINEVKFLKGISKEKHFGSNFNRDAFIALFNNISL